MPPDPIIDEIRRVRHEISEEVGHDLSQLKEALVRLESKFKRSPIDYGGRRASHVVPAAKSDELVVENLASPRSE